MCYHSDTVPRRFDVETLVLDLLDEIPVPGVEDAAFDSGIISIRRSCKPLSISNRHPLVPDHGRSHDSVGTSCSSRTTHLFYCLCKRCDVAGKILITMPVCGRIYYTMGSADCSRQASSNRLVGSWQQNRKPLIGPAGYTTRILVNSGPGIQDGGNELTNHAAVDPVTPRSYISTDPTASGA